jgi:uncharacterized protein YkwD
VTNAAIVLSLLILLFVSAYAFRGWRRGLVVEVIELVGLVVAILAAFLTWPLVQRVADGWAAAMGGAAIFLLVFVGALFAAAWAGRHTASLPAVGAALDGVGGTVVAVTWSSLLATAMLILSITAPGARAHLAEPICQSPVARALLSSANPLHHGGERLAILGRPVLLWLNQRLAETLTLSHNALCDELPIGEPDGTRAPDPTHFGFPAASEDDISIDEEAEQEVFRLLNQAREEAGLEPLEWDDDLRDVGRAHSRDMYLRGYFAHETPECRQHGRDHPDCKDPFDRMRDHGISYNVAGENLALAPTPAQAHDGLMRSPGHRANILNPDFTRGGIGVYVGPYGIMVTQLFAG